MIFTGGLRYRTKMITMKKIISILFMLVGFISFGIGILGTVLPVLPGGPFFLFAVFCFAKSSKRAETWFKNTSTYKKYIVPLLEKRGMPRKEKIRINLIADFFIILSVIMVDIWWVDLIIISLGLYKHYYFIRKIETIEP